MEKQLKYLLLLAAKLTDITEGLVEICSQLADVGADDEDFEQPVYSGCD